MEDIAGGIDTIRKERADDTGKELWFPLMLQYIEESPYGKAHALNGLAGLLTHLEHRKSLEHRIIEAVFKENTLVIKAKTDKTPAELL